MPVIVETRPSVHCTAVGCMGYNVSSLPVLSTSPLEMMSVHIFFAFSSAEAAHVVHKLLHIVYYTSTILFFLPHTSFISISEGSARLGKHTQCQCVK